MPRTTQISPPTLSRGVTPPRTRASISLSSYRAVSPDRPDSTAPLRGMAGVALSGNGPRRGRRHTGSAQALPLFIQGRRGHQHHPLTVELLRPGSQLGHRFARRAAHNGDSLPAD